MATIVYFNGGVNIGFPLPAGQTWTQKYTLEQVIKTRDQSIDKSPSAEFVYTAEMRAADWQAIAQVDEDDRRNEAKNDPRNQLILSIKQPDGSWKDTGGVGIYLGDDARYSAIGFDNAHIGKTCMIWKNTVSQIGVRVWLGTIEEAPE